MGRVGECPVLFLKKPRGENGNFLLFGTKEAHNFSLLRLKAHNRCGSKSVLHSFQSCFGMGWCRKENKKSVLGFHLVFSSFLIICAFAALVVVSTAMASQHPRQMLSYKPSCRVSLYSFLLRVRQTENGLSCWE